jgi:amino acid permease
LKSFLKIFFFTETFDISMGDMNNANKDNNQDIQNSTENSFVRFYLIAYVIVIVLLIISLIVCISIPQWSNDSDKNS